MPRTMDHHANRDCPFPQGRKPPALDAEDRFMKLHGGRGARMIYRTVCLIEAVAGGIILCLQGNRQNKGIEPGPAAGAAIKCGPDAPDCRPAAATRALRTHP
jgi:hypothetical protein